MALLAIVAGNAMFAQSTYDRLMHLSLYDRALAIIRHYETLHRYPDHWPVLGYGHELKPGETYKPRQYSKLEAEIIMRKDYNQFLAYYRDLGTDAYLVAALAYNTGFINANTIATELRHGNRNIRSLYLRYCHYTGQFHKGLLRRRHVELMLLYGP